MTAPLTEFELISRFFMHIGPRLPEVALGIGDDCAVVDVPEGMSLCLSLDTMVEGVHFPKECAPAGVASRAFAAALSDLAAMGAQPSHFTLSLTLPSADAQWLAAFADELGRWANQFRIALVGGDTTRGPLTIALQVHGWVPKGMALTRSGAKVGDYVAVSGSLGDAGAALSLLHAEAQNPDQHSLLNRYYQPAPRVEQGLQLRGLASACIDISDGLVADAGHVASASGVSLMIDADCLPLSASLRAEFPERAKALALNSGDDYELLFTISEANWQALTQRHRQHLFTRIGVVVEGSGVVVTEQGVPLSIERNGYQHFG